MTYARFHLLLTLPVLLLLILVDGGRAIQGGGGMAVGLVLLAVMVFTSPWDNYAAACGIWGFPPGRYLFKIGWLPVEEYAFFVIQSLMVVFASSIALRILPERTSLAVIEPFAPATLAAMGGVLVVWLLAGLLLCRLPRRCPCLHYAWHLFYWFTPIIALQWALAWPILTPRADTLALVTLVVGGYLCLADWIAIRAGVWTFDRAQTTGHTLGGEMPWEEAAFFFLTSLLVAQSYIMLVPEAMR